MCVMEIIIGPEDTDQMDMDSSEHAMKREGDKAGALSAPLFEPIKAEPDFEGTSEENVMEENFEATENVELKLFQDNDCSEHAVKRELDDGEVLMEPLFVPVKTEPEFESVSEETIVEENFEESDIAEDSTAHMTGYPESQSSLPTMCLTVRAPGLKVHSVENNFEEISASNQQLLKQCLSHRGRSPQNSGGTSFCAEKGMTEADREQGKDQLEGCGRNSVDAVDSHYKTEMNEKTSKRKTSSEQGGRQLKRKYLLHCDACSKCFRCVFDLENHQRTHTGERPFECSLCNKTFTTKSILVRHSRVHSEERPHKCSVCEMSFKMNTHLKSHMLLHRGEKPFECSVCGRGFSHSGNLAAHERSHIGEKPHRCTVCGKEFVTSSILTIHMRTHTGEKPYKCTVCGKAFSESGTLTRHTRVHTGEHPFVCKDCGSYFTESGSLRRHRRHAHGDAFPVSLGTDLP